MAAKHPPPRCLVVGYDAGEPSERALTWALHRAGRRGRVVIVHAARRAGELDRARATAELPFLERRDVYAVASCAAEVRAARPGDALIAVADEVDADEVVVGTRRRTGLVSLSGSVCSDLLARCERPVVVVP